MGWKEEKNKRWNRAIDNAISSWSNMKNGIYYSCEKNRYSPEYCQKQIEYFKKLKTKFP